LNKSTTGLYTFRHKLRILERAITKNLSEETSCCGVTLSQCHTLLELSENTNFPAVKLAEVLELDKSTLSRTIESLHKKKLITRTEDESDRRFYLLNLTDEGKKSVSMINTSCDTFYTRLLENVPDDKRESVIESVIILAEAFKKTEQIQCCTNKKGE